MFTDSPGVGIIAAGMAYPAGRTGGPFTDSPGVGIIAATCSPTSRASGSRFTDSPGVGIIAAPEPVGDDVRAPEFTDSPGVGIIAAGQARLQGRGSRAFTDFPGSRPHRGLGGWLASDFGGNQFTDSPESASSRHDRSPDGERVTPVHRLPGSRPHCGPTYARDARPEAGVHRLSKSRHHCGGLARQLQHSAPGFTDSPESASSRRGPFRFSWTLRACSPTPWESALLRDHLRLPHRPARHGSSAPRGVSHRGGMTARFTGVRTPANLVASGSRSRSAAWAVKMPSGASRLCGWPGLG